MLVLKFYQEAIELKYIYKLYKSINLEKYWRFHLEYCLFSSFAQKKYQVLISQLIVSYLQANQLVYVKSSQKIKTKRGRKRTIVLYEDNKGLLIWCVCDEVVDKTLEGGGDCVAFFRKCNIPKYQTVSRGSSLFATCHPTGFPLLLTEKYHGLSRTF